MLRNEKLLNMFSYVQIWVWWKVLCSCYLYLFRYLYHKQTQQTGWAVNQEAVSPEFYVEDGDIQLRNSSGFCRIMYLFCKNHRFPLYNSVVWQL